MSKRSLLMLMLAGLVLAVIVFAFAKLRAQKARIVEVEARIAEAESETKKAGAERDIYIEAYSKQAKRTKELQEKLSRINCKGKWRRGTSADGSTFEECVGEVLVSDSTSNLKEEEEKPILPDAREIVIAPSKFQVLALIGPVIGAGFTYDGIQIGKVATLGIGFEVDFLGRREARGLISIRPFRRSRL